MVNVDSDYGGGRAEGVVCGGVGVKAEDGRREERVNGGQKGAMTR